jgi:Family of unknown function (DUF6152)
MIRFATGNGGLVKDTLVRFFLVAVVSLIVSVPLAAHHGNAAFDNNKLLTVKGAVTEWVWANPHCFLKFDAKDASDNVIHWVAELNNPPEMVRNGWSKQSLKPGDEITVFLIQAKNGNPVGRVQKVVLPDGQVLVAMEAIGTPQRRDDPKPPNEPKQ